MVPVRGEGTTEPSGPAGEHPEEGNGSRLSTGRGGIVRGVEILLVVVGAEGVRLVEEVDGVIVDRFSGAPVDVLEGVLVGIELETETIPAA